MNKINSKFNPNNKNTSFGFTLIELLIVVAIIAILAAIAIPNFLAAQTRSKVSRTLGEYKTWATALESYYVDQNDYPATRAPQPLTTPVSYISSFPKSPWKVIGWTGIADTEFTKAVNTYLYVSRWGNLGNNPSDIQTDYLNYQYDHTGGYNDSQVVRWELKCVGPDGIDNVDESHYAPYPRACYYDPSNGTVSKGDIVWFNNAKGTGRGL